MATKPLPSPEVLRQLLTYNPETGKLFWKERGPEWFNETSDPRRSIEVLCAAWNTRYAGKEALSCLHPSGYLNGAILGAGVKTHKIAWIIEHNATVPEGMEIDHINGDGSDNRLCNLRLATRSENCMNRGSQKNKSSVFRGVNWHKKQSKWIACIKPHGHTSIHLGTFETEEDAARAYDEAARKHYGEFARLNFP